MTPAKLSLAATAVILIVGGTIAVTRHGKHAEVAAEKDALALRAEKLGIDPTATGDSGTVTKRSRGVGKSGTSAMGKRMVAFAREVENHEESGDEDAEEFEKRGLEMQAALAELDTVELEQVIGSLRDAAGLSDETKQNMICVVLLMLGDKDPADALALYRQSADLLDGSLTGSTVVSTTLEKWAKQDPQAALAWMRENSALHPELTDDDSKRDIVAGAAQTDPLLAFQLLEDIGVEDKDAAINAAVETAKTPAQRTALLEALRGYLATLTDEGERSDVLRDSLESMGRGLSGESFDAAQAWISKAALTPEESANFVSGLSYFNTKEDTGRWIEWMAAHIPQEQLGQNVENLIGQWTQQDYLAAGKWLSAATEGPAKSAAVSSYAGTVAEYEPRTAVQWALTLPPGTQRDATLETIYQNWPKSDFAAAQAFAKEHGIQTEPDPETPGDEP